MDENYIMPGVSLHEYIPSPDTSPDKSLGGALLSFARPQKFTFDKDDSNHKHGLNEKHITASIDNHSYKGNLIVLKPTLHHENVDLPNQTRGFVSQSGRKIKVHHHEDTHSPTGSIRIAESHHEVVVLPSDILKHYHVEYLSMSNPFPSKPNVAISRHISRPNEPKNEFDEGISVVPSNLKNKYTLPEIPHFFSRVVRNINSPET